MKAKRLFMGEVMKCRECGKKQRSNPAIESNWTAIQIDDKVIYICPTCWGAIMLGKKKPTW